MTLLALMDVLLAVGLAMRLTRFVVTDDLGGWWIRHPVMRAVVRYEQHHPHTRRPDTTVTMWRGETVAVRMPWRENLSDGLHCPWCVGFWIDVAVLASLWAVGGPGDAAEPWRWIAAAFTLNYVAAHIGARLGDTDGDAE